MKKITLFAFAMVAAVSANASFFTEKVSTGSSTTNGELAVGCGILVLVITAGLLKAFVWGRKTAGK